jgi:site-specific recombinase XerD
MLGHKDSRTTQRYAHVADDVVRRAVESAGAAIVHAGAGVGSRGK